MNGRIYRDIPYTVDKHGGPMLDILLPDEGDGPFPLVVCLQLEGRSVGAEAMLEGGYAVAKVRCSPFDGAAFPAQLGQCRTAIRFLRAHAQPFLLDPDHFVLWGEKADAWLAALLALTMGSAEFDDLTLGYPNETDSVQAAVLVDGIYDLALWEKTDPAAAQAFRTALLSGADAKANLAARYSPLFWATPDAPPVCLFYRENGGLFEQAERLRDALAARIGAEKTDCIPLPESGLKHWDAAYGEICAFLAQWLP